MHRSSMSYLCSSSYQIKIKRSSQDDDDDDGGDDFGISW